MDATTHNIRTQASEPRWSKFGKYVLRWDPSLSDLWSNLFYPAHLNFHERKTNKKTNSIIVWGCAKDFQSVKSRMARGWIHSRSVVVFDVKALIKWANLVAEHGGSSYPVKHVPGTMSFVWAASMESDAGVDSLGSSAFTLREKSAGSCN